MTNRLKNTICYLCGPMDRVDDGGVTWRRNLSPKLTEMGVGVLDPSKKPTEFAKEDDNFRNNINNLKRTRKFDDVHKEMKDIAAIDLRMVDIAHFLVMYMDMDIHMCGSYHEAFVAVSQKKPVLVVCKQGKSAMPNWMFGVMPHQHMFGNWSLLLEYLHHVNEDEDVDHLKRWRFFDFDEIYKDVLPLTDKEIVNVYDSCR
tara:strand:- start:1771 stop:2373 length:603 start_codon:yes stop_codon:yes gene_type:complete